MAKDVTLEGLMHEAYDKAGLTFEDVISHKGYISTGNLALDWILGGGIPRGRTTELYGPSQSGKTTAAVMAAASCQRAGMPVLYLDYEQALDTDYLRALGVDVDDRKLFLPFGPESLEEGADLATKAINTGNLGLVIVDSVAAMTPAKIIDDDGESRTTGMERARLLTNMLNKMNPSLARTGTAAVFINHERVEVNTGSRPGHLPPSKTTVGGTALKYYASTRVRFGVWKKFKATAVDPLTGNKEDITHSVLSKAEVTKNKTGSPFGTADLYLVLGQGFSNPHAAMNVLVGAGKVKKPNAQSYVFPPELYNPSMKPEGEGGRVAGLSNILDLAEGDLEWGSKLVKSAQEVLAPHGSLMEESQLVDDLDGQGSPEVSTPVDDTSESDLDELRVAVPRPAAVPRLTSSGFSSDDFGSARRLIT
jgi:recombination protein RecA